MSTYLRIVLIAALLAFVGIGASQAGSQKGPSGIGSTPGGAATVKPSGPPLDLNTRACSPGFEKFNDNGNSFSCRKRVITACFPSEFNKFGPNLQGQYIVYHCHLPPK